MARAWCGDGLFRWYAATASVISGALICVYALVPSARVVLSGEDRVTEWMSAGFFAASFFVGLFRFFTATGRPRAYFLLPWVGLIGFLDELSFGQRHLDLEMPVVRDVELDAVHDVVQLLHRVLTEDLSPAVATVVVVAVVVAALLACVWLRRRAIPFLHGNPPLVYAVFAAGFLVPALFIDLQFSHLIDYRMFLEELLELNAAVSWLFVSLAIGREIAPQGSRGNH
jgi:hypothetical protein